MAICIKPVEEERCITLSYEGEMPPREIAAARYEAQGLLKARRWKRIIMDVTQFRSVPKTSELVDFAKGFSDQVPLDARVALLVRPEQVRDANFVEKVARKAGVFLSYFVDPEKAALWMQRSQPFRRKLVQAAWVQSSEPCKSNPTISRRAHDHENLEPLDHYALCSRRNVATSEPGRATRQAVVAEK
jgi:hypothetical protein